MKFRFEIQDFVALAGANVVLALVSSVTYTLATYATHSFVKWAKEQKAKEKRNVQPA